MKKTTGVSSIASLLNKSKEVSLGSGNEVYELPLDLIEFDLEQPRQELSNEEIGVIVRSLEPEGSIINQPITVWQKNSLGKYVIKFGEKRVRASIIAKRKTIRAIIDNRFDYDNDEHRAINFAEQYIENESRGGLTPLDDCVALKKLKSQLGSLKKVKERIGAKSIGTISDKISVAVIKSDHQFSFLLDLYMNDSLKFKDLTMIKGILDVLKKNPDFYEEIKVRVVNAANKGVVNRKWVEKLLLVDWSNLNVDPKDEPEDNKEYIFRPIKKVKLNGLVLFKGEKIKCEILLDRVDKSEGYIWVNIESECDPVRVNLSDLSLTEVF